MFNLLESTISILSPRWAAQRLAYRHQMSRLRAAAGVHESMQKMFGSRHGGYEAGKLDRLKGRVVGSPHENDIPRAQVAALRWRSWNLHRNCPQARKACRTLGAKVIGRGLSPQPQATHADGTPFVEFRRRARQVFEEFTKECDYRGKPGCGGQNFVTLCKTALRNTQLSGGVLYQMHHLDRREQRQRGLYVPLQIQLLHIDRLDERKHGKNNYYGIQVDTAGRVTGYHVQRGGSAANDDSLFVPAERMRHLFAEEDVDQMLGTPWLGAMLLTADDRRGYEYSELIAAEMAACCVAGFRRASGQTGGIGLMGDGGERDLTDADGNPVTRLQPGMFFDLGTSGELQLLNPARPNSNAESFLSHLVRTEAVSVPGVKSSTLTGDYRNSSFSSERSADNDAWPEIEELQDWFAVGFCQPIYDECITAAAMAGLFDDVPGFSTADFADRKREFLKTNWQGPVSRSINPKDDADASRVRVQNGTSSPQREAAQLGRDWREVLQELHEFIGYASELQLPEDMWRQSLGMDSIDTQSEADQTAADGGDAAAIAALKTEMDLYGVAVRAGVVTPTPADEQHYRQRIGLPAMTSDVDASWQEDGGVRRPITLVQPAVSTARDQAQIDTELDEADDAATENEMQAQAT